MRSRVCRFLLLFALSGCFAAAQRGPIYLLCIDTVAVNAKSVLIGKITAVHESARNAPGSDVDIGVETWLKGGGERGMALMRIEVPGRDSGPLERLR